MSAPATETQTPMDQLEQLEADARSRIAELEQDERRLALDALTDEDAAQELKTVQSERASAEGQVRQATMAREEHGRREAEAERAAAVAERDGHMQRSRELEGHLVNAAGTFDKKIAEAMMALRSFMDLSLEQGQALDAAGERARRLPPWTGNAAVMYALIQADVPRGVIVLEGVRAKPQPLAEGRPSQPLGEGES